MAADFSCLRFLGSAARTLRELLVSEKPRTERDAMPLICQFASPRSKPERIQSWICYLERMFDQYPEEAAFREMVEGLRRRAETWLPDPETVH